MIRDSMREVCLGFLLMLVLLLGCSRPVDGVNGGGGEEYDPRNISRTEDNSYQPTIAVSADGTVYVCWMESKGLFFRYREAGGEWSDIDTIVESGWGPDMVVDPFGNVHVVWEEEVGGGRWRICYRERYEDGGWSGVKVISGGGDGEQPRIGVDSMGVVHVVWNEGVLRHRERYLDGTWSEIDDGSVYVVNPDMVVDGGGGVHVVYEAGNHEIKYIYRSPGGEWSEPVQLSESGWYSRSPSVAVSIGGEVWVSWVEAGEGLMCYRVREVGGGWSVLDTVPGIVGYPGVNRVRYDREGNLHCVWQEWRGGVHDVYYRVCCGGVWSDVKDVSSTLEWDSMAPDFEVGRGGVYVVWSEREEDEWGIKYNWEIYFEFIPWP